MPDHERGYVHRDRGLSPQDKRMGRIYRANLAQATVSFNAANQREIISAVLESCEKQELRCHGIATETTHVHVLVSWKSDRKWEVVRKQIRRTITSHLIEKFKRRNWFSKSPSRKRVADREHFDHLVKVYFPGHSGWKWLEGRGMFR
jgi:REP element-mobilizing transposase RayT